MTASGSEARGWTAARRGWGSRTSVPSDPGQVGHHRGRVGLYGRRHRGDGGVGNGDHGQIDPGRGARRRAPVRARHRFPHIPSGFGQGPGQRGPGPGPSRRPGPKAPSNATGPTASADRGPQDRVGARSGQRPEAHHARRPPPGHSQRGGDRARRRPAAPARNPARTCGDGERPDRGRPPSRRRSTAHRRRGSAAPLHHPDPARGQLQGPALGQQAPGADGGAEANDHVEIGALLGAAHRLGLVHVGDGVHVGETPHRGPQVTGSVAEVGAQSHEGAADAGASPVPGWAPFPHPAVGALLRLTGVARRLIRFVRCGRGVLGRHLGAGGDPLGHGHQLPGGWAQLPLQEPLGHRDGVRASANQSRPQQVGGHHSPDPVPPPRCRGRAPARRPRGPGGRPARRPGRRARPRGR